MELRFIRSDGKSYSLSYFDENKLWLTNQDAEGMTIPTEIVFDLLDSYFKEHF